MVGQRHVSEVNLKWLAYLAFHLTFVFQASVTLHHRPQANIPSKQKLIDTFSISPSARMSVPPAFSDIPKASNDASEPNGLY